MSIESVPHPFTLLHSLKFYLRKDENQGKFLKLLTLVIQLEDHLVKTHVKNKKHTVGRALEFQFTMIFSRFPCNSQLRKTALIEYCTLSEIAAHSTVYLHLNKRWAVFIQLDFCLRWWYTAEWAFSSESVQCTDSHIHIFLWLTLITSYHGLGVWFSLCKWGSNPSLVSFFISFLVITIFFYFFYIKAFLIHAIFVHVSFTENKMEKKILEPVEVEP